jgi:hypothetical protein
MNISQIKSTKRRLRSSIYRTDFIDAPLTIGQAEQISLVKCAITYKYSILTRQHYMKTAPKGEDNNMFNT